MFDPYYKWLGIPPADQPPNHYRLLGVNLFESDLDVIEGAADRLMSYVRQYQSGENAAEAARILNELAIARLCLLKSDKKAAYDIQLRKTLTPAPEAPKKAQSPAPFFELLPQELMSDGPALERTVPATKRKKKSKKSRSSSGLDSKVVIGGIVVVVVVVVLIANRSRPVVPPIDKPQETTRQQTAAPEAATPSSPNDSKPMESASASPTSAPREPLPFEWKEPDPAPETTGDALNLLTSFDPTQSVVAGKWTQSNDAWVGSSGSRAYLQPINSDNYQIKLSVRRLERTGPISIGFMTSGHQGVLALDWAGAVSGLFVDGQEPAANCTARRGPLFQGQSAAQITMTVRPNRVTATFDGRTIVDWFGDPKRLFVPADWGMACWESPFVVIGDASYEISSAESVAIQPIEVSSLEHLEQPVDALPMFDLKRDTVEGAWTVRDRALISPPDKGRIYLPTIVPREYTLSARVELAPQATGGHNVIFGLAGQNSCFQISLTNGSSGLDTLDGKRWNANETVIQGSRLKPGVMAQIDCTVTANRIRMEIDGKSVVDWQGDFQRCLVPEDWSMPDGRRLFLGSTQSTTFRDVTLGPPIALPTLPDHPPVSTGESVNLLPIINPPRDARGGTWELTGSGLRCRGDATFNLLGIPFDLPDEYKFTVRVARVQGGARNNEVLYLGIPSGDDKVLVMIDGGGSTSSYVEIDGGVNFINAPKALIPQAGTREIVAIVRRKGLQILVDGTPMLDWKGDPARWRVLPNCVTPGSRISLGSWNQGFLFDKLIVEKLASSSFPAVHATPADGKLMPLINLDRDTRCGIWRFESNRLVSPVTGISRMQIPVTPPDRYSFDVTVERKQGAKELLLGLPVGGTACILAFDADQGRIAGIDNLDGRRFFDRSNVTCRNYRPPLFPEGKAVRVRCRVLPDTIIVNCDNKQVISWHGDQRRLTAAHYPYHEIDQKSPWIGASESSFSFRNLELKPLEEDAAARVRERFTGPFPKVSQLEVPFTVVSGSEKDSP